MCGLNNEDSTAAFNTGAGRSAVEANESLALKRVLLLQAVSGSSLESCCALTPSAQYMVVLVLQFIWRQRGSKPRGSDLRVSMTQQRSRHLQALQVRLWSLELPPTRARAETIPCRCTLASSTAPTCMPHPASHPDPESSAEGADVMCSHAPSQVALAAASARRLRATHRTVETPAHGAVGLN